MVLAVTRSLVRSGVSVSFASKLFLDAEVAKSLFERSDETNR